MVALFTIAEELYHTNILIKEISVMYLLIWIQISFLTVVLF